MKDEIVPNNRPRAYIELDIRNMPGAKIIRVSSEKIAIEVPTIETRNIPDDFFIGMSERAKQFAQSEMQNALYEARLIDVYLALSKRHAGE